MSVEQTLKERGSRYGDFSVHAEICQDFMRVMKRARNQNAWPDLSDVQRQALTVIADKIARILSGDPDYADNWHDIQGYAKLVEERLPAAQHEQESRIAAAIDNLFSHAADAAYPPQVTMHFGARPEYPEQHPVCPDCGAPEGELHYVLCPRLPVPEAHAEAVEAAFAEQAQFDEARADIIGQNGNEGEHYEQPVDVNDWRTWQVGDLVERISRINPIVYTFGALYPVVGFNDDSVQIADDFGEGSRCEHNAEALTERFKWHSRPAKTDE